MISTQATINKMLTGESGTQRSALKLKPQAGKTQLNNHFNSNNNLSYPEEFKEEKQKLVSNRWLNDSFQNQSSTRASTHIHIPDEEPSQFSSNGDFMIVPGPSSTDRSSSGSTSKKRIRHRGKKNKDAKVSSTGETAIEFVGLEADTLNTETIDINTEYVKKDLPLTDDLYLKEEKHSIELFIAPIPDLHIFASYQNFFETINSRITSFKKYFISEHNVSKLNWKDVYFFDRIARNVFNLKNAPELDNECTKLAQSYWDEYIKLKFSFFSYDHLQTCQSVLSNQELFDASMIFYSLVPRLRNKTFKEVEKEMTKAPYSADFKRYIYTGKHITYNDTQQIYIHKRMNLVLRANSDEKKLSFGVLKVHPIDPYDPDIWVRDELGQDMPCREENEVAKFMHGIIVPSRKKLEYKHQWYKRIPMKQRKDVMNSAHTKLK